MTCKTPGRLFENGITVTYVLKITNRYHSLQKIPLAFNPALPSPPNIFDLLSDNHGCFVYRDLINTDDNEPLRQKMDVKMEQQASRNIYSKRKMIVEPVLDKSKIVAFGVSVFEAKKKSRVSFHWYVPAMQAKIGGWF